MHSEPSQPSNLSGMTVNERLFTLGLLEEFDSLVRRGEREGMVALLSEPSFPIAMRRHARTACFQTLSDTDIKQ